MDYLNHHLQVMNMFFRDSFGLTELNLLKNLVIRFFESIFFLRLFSFWDFLNCVSGNPSISSKVLVVVVIYMDLLV